MPRARDSVHRHVRLQVRLRVRRLVRPRPGGELGAEAAAQRYFRKSAKNLTRREAALLARSLPNPLRRNPARPTSRLNALAGQLQARMAGAAPYSDCLKP